MNELLWIRLLFIMVRGRDKQGEGNDPFQQLSVILTSTAKTNYCLHDLPATYGYCLLIVVVTTCLLESTSSK
jgi:hypothetical protein